MAAVVGRLQIRDWTDKEGNKRRSAEVIAENIHFTESKKSRESSYGSNDSKDDPGLGYATPVAPSDFSEIDMDDGDLPF